MGLRISFVLLLFFFLLGIATSSFLEYDVAETPAGGKGRSLLPRNSDCPFDVANMNYTIVTSKCQRQPNYYKAKPCCKSFKKLTCKHRDDLSSDDNTCAIQMFVYLRRYGKYPVGLFAYLCKEGKSGLDCSGY